jgi:hypothetical protein
VTRPFEGEHSNCVMAKSRHLGSMSADGICDRVRGDVVTLTTSGSEGLAVSTMGGI